MKYSINNKKGLIIAVLLVLTAVTVIVLHYLADTFYGNDNIVTEQNLLFESSKSPMENVYFSDDDFDSTNPVEFLKKLKTRPNAICTVLSVPDGWVKYEHLKELVKYVDSKEPCARVVSALSSYLPQSQSTVGREAIFLIEGFLKGNYPPHLHSEVNFARDVQWYKTELEDYVKAKQSEKKQDDNNDKNKDNLQSMSASNSTESATPKEVIVDTVEAFYHAIEPNVTIYLKLGKYMLDELKVSMGSNEYAAMFDD